LNQVNTEEVVFDYCSGGDGCFHFLLDAFCDGLMIGFGFSFLRLSVCLSLVGDMREYNSESFSMHIFLSYGST
jgi:hypothetical protein